jgi:CRP-like cAMP-binding protein
MHNEHAVIRPLDHVRAALDAEFHTTAEIAERCGLTPSTVAPPLGRLRRSGEAEYVARPDRRSLWRKAPGGTEGSH